MNGRNIVRCPSCGKEIDVSEILYRQIEEEMKIRYQREFLEKEKELNRRLGEIDSEKKRIEEEKERMRQAIEEQVKLGIKRETRRIEDEIRKKVREENREEIDILKKELNEKHTQLQEQKRLEIELERLKREKDALKEQITLEKEKELTEKLGEEKERIRKMLEDEYVLKIREKEKIIESMNREIEEAKRKSEQGCVQLQGEVQELELRDLLKRLYPFDEISDVRPGQRGADVIQIVRTRSGDVCGKIYYESKRTKEFKSEWIGKLKEDSQKEKADISVIVTEAMPKDVRDFCLRDGVWICRYTEISNLSFILRHMLEKVHSVTIVQKDRNTKMDMLYNYLTGNEFKVQFEMMVRGFMELRSSYEKEKERTIKIFKEREKQINRILENAAEFYGSIRGIAGSAIPEVREFESDTGVKSLKSPPEDEEF